MVSRFTSLLAQQKWSYSRCGFPCLLALSHSPQRSFCVDRVHNSVHARHSYAIILTAGMIEAGATTTPIILTRVLSKRERHAVVHLVDEVSLFHGLKAPRVLDLPRQPYFCIRESPIFILLMVAHPRHGGLSRNHRISFCDIHHPHVRSAWRQAPKPLWKHQKYDKPLPYIKVQQGSLLVLVLSLNELVGNPESIF